VQLPQREYSPAAIEARNQLIGEAYSVLSDPEQRQRYDASYFAFSYEAQPSNDVESTNAQRSDVSTAIFEPNSPSIEIADELFVGALLILQELGEYELVLDLGLSFLTTDSVNLERGQLGEFDWAVHSDVVLTSALAYLELGREQWQQGQYENAASSLEFGQNLLTREGLFPNVAGEMKADLDKLRPYRILELLAQSEANVAARQQGLQLLQAILQERKGIDGTGDDGSGLSVEEFLRFIQQLRSYLSAAEQQTLFEAESQRPSAVASYLAVYALIARGFAGRLPVLIRQAKLMLVRLSKRQDLYLEQAICALLLGQTAQASRALELSQEYEPLAFIREHSQGAPDLLPGLCLYSESWLQNEVFPNFRDLANQGVSLKEYFADQQVQAYLEALPTELEATDAKAETEHKSMRLSSQTDHVDRSSEKSLASQSSSTRSLEEQKGAATRSYEARGTKQEAEFFSNPSPSNPQRQLLQAGEPVQRTGSSSPLTGVAVLANTERIARPTTNHNSADALSQVQSPQRSRRRTKNRASRSNEHEHSKPLFSSQDRSNTKARGIQAVKKTRLVLLLASSVLGILVLWFLASQVYGLFRYIFAKPAMTEAQLMVEMNQPPVAIPIPQPEKQPVVAQALNQATALQVIESWLATKSAAFGQNHAVNKLEQILVQPALAQWQQRVQNDKASNRTRQYKHSVKVNSVQTKASSPDHAQVVATVDEAAQVYDKGKLNRATSYNETLRVMYDLVRQDGQWRIQTMKVLK
jgi:curved DNA-binding protein CbpA